MKRRFTDDEEKEIRRAYEAGVLVKSMAEEYGVCRETIRNVVRRAGGELRQLVGADHPHWKGGRKPSTDGYVFVWMPRDHPFYSMAYSNGTVLEHRLVMAEFLGRPLLPSETVHHKNNQRDDNVISNLQLRQGAHGKGMVVQCLDCGSHNVDFVDMP